MSRLRVALGMSRNPYQVNKLNFSMLGAASFNTITVGYEKIA
ncbi:MAG TPA: hypothetical protein VLV32_03255 [Burkholderiales bacterium]|nr:hypothetical protein [Burkholderiales bacterium]